MGESKKKSRSVATQRAWNLVRMALLWGRKGGIFKKWHMFELRNLVSKHLKALAHHSNSVDDSVRYLGEKQLSFDETPVFNVKMHRPASMRFLLPCIAPPVDFDYDFELDRQDNDTEDVRSYGYYNDCCNEKCERADGTYQDEEEDEKGVDVRADEFIANFYQQMKLQRQISYLQYKEHNDVV
ncbi:hypothetical protein IGI04_039256 [Brassica rapa subsp. trilocularis]|uniref:Uncharacterized protein n=2 Tax=Brassica campestris TaxID=3711 RepID=A0A3P6D1T3_BRACM|nr:hypothetical protein IGI04_039256 [Brassica rapa subsp. trilocularis]CAG7908895.1 unnamed protein product [Brassica rapa]VDD16701.1 unnamed protein product [Brassica rapa]